MGLDFDFDFDLEMEMEVENWEREIDCQLLNWSVL